MQNGQQIEALDDFATAAREDPDNSDIYHHRGQVNAALWWAMYPGEGGVLLHHILCRGVQSTTKKWTQSDLRFWKHEESIRSKNNRKTNNRGSIRFSCAYFIYIIPWKNIILHIGKILLLKNVYLWIDSYMILLLWSNINLYMKSYIIYFIFNFVFFLIFFFYCFKSP